MAKVTVEELSKHIQNRLYLYEAVLRNEYYLPKIKSTMITEAYLYNVMNGKTFCPKFQDIKLKPCPRLPSKEVLLNKLNQVAAMNSWQSIGIDDKH